MEIKFRCPVCNRKLSAEMELFGETIECPICGETITVPDTEDATQKKSPVIPKLGLPMDFRGQSRPFAPDAQKVRSGKQQSPKPSPSSFQKKRGSGIPHASHPPESLTKIKTESEKKSHFPVIFILFFVLLLVGGVILFLLLQNRSGLRKAKPELEIRVQPRTLTFPAEKTGSSDSSFAAVTGDKPGTVPPRYHYIWLEAEKTDSNAIGAINIEPSFEIDTDNECSGNKYLVIREDCGSGWTSPPSGSGKAEYDFDIPSPGEYYLWARVKWESGCSDAFFVYIDDIKPGNRKDFTQKGDQNTLGKDTTFHTWHWYCRHVFNLNKGGHKLTVKNQDDGSMVDMFFLTDNSCYVPHSIEKWIADMDSANWDFDNRHWKIREDADGERSLLKESEENFPVLLSSVNAGCPYYLSFITESCSEFRIIFDYQDKDNYFYIEKIGLGLCLKAVKNGKEEILHDGDFPVPKIEPGKYFIELFREENKASLVINDALMLQEKINTPINGKIAFDVNNGGFIKDVKIHPLEQIHIGCCHYAEFQQHPFSVIDGKWEVAGSFFPATKSGLTTLGDLSWKNYQASCMIQVPRTGAAGIGLCYRDKKNHYLLKLKKDKQELSRIKDGMEKILASQTIEMDTKDFKRITLNIHENTIHVFYGGRKLFQVKDDTLFSGQFFLMVKDADNFRVDDLEIWSIEQIYSGDKNERLPFLKPTAGARVINSVMDAFGATGGFHPGDYADDREEAGLREIMNSISGKTVSSPAEVLDFQWLTFDPDSFQWHPGLGKEPGFIIAQSFNPDEKKYLWSTENLFGDWEFSFQALGKCNRLGVLAYEMTGGAAGAGKYAFTIHIPNGSLEKEKYLDIKETSAPLVWNDEEWHKLIVRKNGEILSFHLNDNELGAYRAVSKNIILRPAVFYENGTVFLDNLICHVYPDMFYNFEYNQPWSLALSDWDADCDGTIKHGGGYYSYLILSNSEKPAALCSKRKFTGDFTLSGIIDLDDVEKFTLSLEDSEKISASERFEITRNQIAYFSGENQIAAGKLKNFSTEERRLTTVRLMLVNGCAYVYINDELGSQRLAMTQPVSYPKDKPFKIKISGFPKLKINKIMIWGEEAED